MARISVIGIGKLGAPLALSIARHHDVVGFDVNPEMAAVFALKKYPHRELRAQEYLEQTTMRVVGSVDEAVAHGDVVFVIVQTPHRPEFEGVTRLPVERADFDYTYLRSAVEAVAAAAAKLQKRIALVVMSTVLPGTMDREIRPLLNEYTALVYSPAFPAMGTAIIDYENPEFVLVGVDDRDAADLLRSIYAKMNSAPIVEMSVRSAEATKVFYNSFISAKIALANAWMEVCEHLGANCDDVTRALSLAKDRVVSPKYLKAGMGDGGACHPRDGIALSWLSRELGMGYDLFGDLMRIREKQADWLADVCWEHVTRRGLDVVILGKAYKAGTNLTVGSCATLLRNILDERRTDRLGMKQVGIDHYDPHVDPPRTFLMPAVFIVATDHSEFYGMTFPVGSVVVDPWGRMADREGVEVVRVGRR